MWSNDFLYVIFITVKGWSILWTYNMIVFLRMHKNPSSFIIRILSVTYTVDDRDVML